MSDIEEARRVLRIEAQAVLDLAERLDARFEKAVQLALDCSGKVILTGMGKSGQIARKISSTLSSTGTPSLFLHPAESSHGDLGVVSKGDLVVAISYGGDLPELASLLTFVSRKGVPLIAMTANPESALGRAAAIVLDISVKEEACPLGLAPTASSIVTLALGDAFAMALLKRKGFRREEFAEFHPGGKLGRRLLTRVRDVMHTGDALPLVPEDEALTKVVSAMTSKNVRGVAGVVDRDGNLIGVITDGDIRRRLDKNNSPFTETAKDLMSRTPKTIDSGELAEKAAFLMQQFRIQILFVVDKASTHAKAPIGLIHLQDLLAAGVL
jgi:arabinose-5-phosphate isomerase